MKRAKKLVSLLLAAGMLLGVVSCAAAKPQVGADERNDETFQATISTSLVGDTVALLDGGIYEFCKNYEKLSSQNCTDGRDLYAPKPLHLEWTNTEEGALYYTVEIGLKSDLSDAQSYLTFDTSLDVEYLFSAKHYYYRITADYEGKTVKSRIFDFYTEDIPRTIWIEGISNTRDMGGRLTENGEYRVKQGMIYRGGHGDNITAEGRRVLVDVLGVKTDLDLREGTRAASPIDASLNFVNVSGPYYVSTKTGINSAEYKEALITEVKTFANPDNYPIYFHCSLGRDRAGTIAFLISALLGVSEIDLYRDYEMSFFSVNGYADAKQGKAEIPYLVGTAFYGLIDYMKQYNKPTLAENVEEFMKSYLNITQEEIDTIRSVMLEEVNA